MDGFFTIIIRVLIHSTVPPRHLFPSALLTVANQIKGGHPFAPSRFPRLSTLIRRTFRLFIGWFTYVLLFMDYLTGSLPGLFLLCSPPLGLPKSSGRRFGTGSCSADSEGPNPHQECSQSTESKDSSRRRSDLRSRAPRGARGQTKMGRCVFGDRQGFFD